MMGQLEGGSMGKGQQDDRDLRQWGIVGTG